MNDKLDFKEIDINQADADVYLNNLFEVSSFEKCMISCQTLEERELWREKWTKCHMTLQFFIDGLCRKYLTEEVRNNMIGVPVVEHLRKKLIVYMKPDILNYIPVVQLQLTENWPEMEEEL